MRTYWQTVGDIADEAIGGNSLIETQEYVRGSVDGSVQIMDRHFGLDHAADDSDLLQMRMTSAYLMAADVMQEIEQRTALGAGG